LSQLLALGHFCVIPRPPPNLGNLIWLKFVAKKTSGQVPTGHMVRIGCGERECLWLLLFCHNLFRSHRLLLLLVCAVGLVLFL
jgi:hypothetical protein